MFNVRYGELVTSVFSYFMRLCKEENVKGDSYPLQTYPPWTDRLRKCVRVVYVCTEVAVNGGITKHGYQRKRVRVNVASVMSRRDYLHPLPLPLPRKNPRSICLDASRENWVSYTKSRLTGKVPGKNNVKRRISSF